MVLKQIRKKRLSTLCALALVLLSLSSLFLVRADSVLAQVKEEKGSWVIESAANTKKSKYLYHGLQWQKGSVGGEPAYCMEFHKGFPRTHTLTYTKRKPLTGVQNSVLYYGYPYHYRKTDKTVGGEKLTPDEANAATQFAMWIIENDLFPGKGWDNNGFYVDLHHKKNKKPIKETAWQRFGKDDKVVRAAFGIAKQARKNKNLESVGYVLTGSNNDKKFQKMAVPLRPVEVTFEKRSSNPECTNNNQNYSLAGARYDIYTKDTNKKMASIVFDEKGRANTSLTLNAHAEFYALETRSPKGYAKNPNKIFFSTKNTTHVVFKDIPINDPQHFFVHKIDAQGNTATPQGDATLEGAEFSVKFYAGQYSLKNLPSKPTRSWVIRTGKDGRALLSKKYQVAGDKLFLNEINIAYLPLGTVTTQEIKAPKGYLLGKQELYLTNIVSDNSLDAVHAYNAPVIKEEVVRARLTIQKKDAQTGLTRAQNTLSFAGARFEVINASASSVYVDGKAYKPQEVCARLTTNTEGKASIELPYGTYTIREIKAPEGYKVSGEQTIKLAQATPAHAEYTAEVLEELVRTDLSFEKRSTEGHAMPNVVFKLTHKETGESHLVVTDKNGKFSSAARPHTQNTNANDKVLDEQGNVHEDLLDTDAGIWFYGTDKALPDNTRGALSYGHYVLEELRSSATHGHNLIRKEFVVDDTHTPELDLQTLTDSIVRGDLSFEKHSTEGHAMPNVVFKLTHIETGESHLVITDEHGKFSSAVHPHTQNTNANDQALDADGHVREDLLEADAGIWFYGTDKALPDNTRGALSYGHYVLEELRSSATYAHTLVRCEFEVTEAHKADVDLKTLEDAPLKILTELSQAKTREKLLDVHKLVTLIDTVHYEGLVPGKSYTLKGILIDKQTAKPVLYQGKAIEATTSFIAKHETGTAEVVFEFDATGFEGRTFVAFERLYENDIEVCAHTDIADTHQTISFKTPPPPPPYLPPTSDATPYSVIAVLASVALCISGFALYRLIRRG